MSRENRTVVWQESDDKFAVSVQARSDRPGYRVRSGFRGGDRDTRSAPGRDEAIAIGQAIWKLYLDGALTAPELAPETVAQVLDAIERRTDITAATRRGYTQVWTQLTRAVGESRSIHRVATSDIEAWLSGWSGVTRATYLRTVRAVYRWAIRQGWTSRDPTAEVAHAKAPGRIGTWLPWDRWPLFLSHCSPAHRIRAGFALETGLRAGEVMAARPDWVQRGIGRASIRIAEDPVSGFVPKWGSSRAVPLTDTALALLDQAREMWPGSAYLFTGRKLSNANLARENREACRRAGIRPAVTFHGLRRSAGAHWLDCGVGMFEVSRLLGHQSIATTERWYAGVAESTLTRAIEGVMTRRGR